MRASGAGLDVRPPIHHFLTSRPTTYRSFEIIVNQSIIWLKLNGRVAAADSLKSETFCRDLKNVVNPATEPTPAAAPTPVLAPTAPEPLVTSSAHQAHANTTLKSSCSHDAIRGAMHDALSRVAHGVSWQTIAPRLAVPSTATGHDLSSHRVPLSECCTALPAPVVI